MMTFKEFMSACGVPERTLRRMIASGELKPAQHNPKGKPSYFDAPNVATAKALYEDLKHGKKSPTKAADNVEAAPVTELKIDLEFQQLIPPLADSERNQLEKNLLRDGIQDPLKIWQGVIVDGHNRYEIAQAHGLEFKTVELEFASRDDAVIWIIKNQFGRRNLSAYDRSILALKLKPVIAAKAKEKQIESGGAVPQKSAKPPIETRQEIAKAAGVSHDTIAKVEKIEAQATPEVKAALKSGDLSINAAYEAVKAGAMTVDDVTNFKTRKEKPAPKPQEAKEPARPTVEAPPEVSPKETATSEDSDAGKIFVGDKPLDSLKSIVVPDDDLEQHALPSEDDGEKLIVGNKPLDSCRFITIIDDNDAHDDASDKNKPHELDTAPVINNPPKDDSEPPAQIYNKITALRDAIQWLNFIVSIGDCINEKQLNALIKLFGEYFVELEKEFIDGGKATAILKRVIALVKEINCDIADLAAKVSIEIDRLKAKADTKKISPQPPRAERDKAQ